MSPSPRHVSVLLSFPPQRSATDAPPIRHALALVRELGRIDAGSIPIAWNVASSAVCTPGDEDAAEFRTHYLERRERVGDTLCPMGLTGAPNSALAADEVAAELEWSVSNIWGTGARDSLRHDPVLIVPAGPDTLRRETCVSYGESPVPVGVLGTGADGGWLSIIPNGDGSRGRAFAVVSLNGVAPQGIGRKLITREATRRQKATRGEGCVVVWCSVSSDADRERVLAVLIALDETFRKPAWRCAPLDPSDAAHVVAPELLPLDQPFITPDSAGRATELRRRRGSKINTRRVLEVVAGPGAADHPMRDHGDRTATDESGRGARDFIASMLGMASIPGTTATALFREGRLCGLAGPAAKPGTLPSARSLLVDDSGRRIEDRVESCFSFESEISRGLRAESILADETGSTRVRIGHEFSFVGDHDALVVSQHVLVESVAADATLWVLGLPVSARATCAVTGSFADGSSYDHDATWARRESLVWGEAFQIWDGQQRVTLVPLTESGRPMVWTVTLLAEPEPRVVVGGRYALAGGAGRPPVHHHVSFLMIRGELDDELVGRALAGRIPPDIVGEIAAGTAAELAMRSR